MRAVSTAFLNLRGDYRPAAEFARSDAMPGASLQALSVTSSDRVVLGDKVEMKFGSELQTIQFMAGSMPSTLWIGGFSSHAAHSSGYRYASAVPTLSLEDRLGVDRSAAMVRIRLRT